MAKLTNTEIKNDVRALREDLQANYPALMNRKQVAKFLGVKAGRLKKMIRREEFPVAYCQVDKQDRWMKPTVLRWIMTAAEFNGRPRKDKGKGKKEAAKSPKETVNVGKSAAKRRQKEKKKKAKEKASAIPTPHSEVTQPD